MKNRLREFRDAADMTLEQVAEKARTSHQQVQRLETGKRRLTIAWLERLAQAMGYEASDIIGRHKPDHISLLRLIEGLDQDETRIVMGVVRGILGERAAPRQQPRERRAKHPRTS